jgi:hypothetical protein
LFISDNWHSHTFNLCLCLRLSRTCPQLSFQVVVFFYQRLESFGFLFHDRWQITELVNNIGDLS